jgi:hypothetical protein
MFSSQNLSTDSISFLTQPMTFKDSAGNTMLSCKNFYLIPQQTINEVIEGTNPNLTAGSLCI